MLKRGLDIILAGTGLILLLIPLLIIGCAIALTSGFPVLFRQTRVGQGGRDFTLIKFRTMTVQAGSERGSFDAGSSSRVTRIGRILRKTKLDEFPQLWNVLKGDMSLVGPRPEVRKWVEIYPDRWARVLALRPGITDPASIQFRNEEELLATAKNPDLAYRNEILPQKLSLYENYVQTQSLRRDLYLILRTITAVFFN